MYTSSFFKDFPRIRYNLNENAYESFQTPSNIFFRVGILNEIKNNSVAYTKYTIRDSDKIHILAEKFYGDQQLYWIIALANDMVDPVHDWPKDYYAFDNYIVSKYGSLTAAKTGIHHYEKRILRKNNAESSETTVVLEITETTYNSLAETEFIQYNLVGGGTVDTIITRHAITNYDWEENENNKKREIKIIKEMYVGQIREEYSQLLREVNGLPIGYRTIT